MSAERHPRKGVTVNLFRHTSLKELTDQQVRFAPVSVRLDQLRRAEILLAEIEPAKEYPYAFVCYRITEYRPDVDGSLIVGTDLIHDVALFISQVARSMPAMPIEEVAEPVLTL